MINMQIVAGRFTADPELRATNSGVSVCSFTIASDEDRKREDGTRDTDFVDCVAWRNKAEFVAQYFKKGQMAIVTGRPKKRSYKDNDGVTRYKTELEVERINFCGGKQESAQAAAAESEAPAGTNPFAAIATEGEEPLPFGFSNDDLPF